MFATIWLAGISVGSISLAGSGMDCADMVAMMQSDTQTAYAEKGAYGLATDTGAIYRVNDWDYTCETSHVSVGTKMEAVKG